MQAYAVKRNWILWVLLLALLVLAGWLLTAYPDKGQAAPQAVPFVREVDNDIIWVWYPMHPEVLPSGSCTLKDTTTQTEYDVSLDWYGNEGDKGIYRSSLPKFDGIQVIESCVMGNGQEVDTDGNNFLTSILQRLYAALVSNNWQEPPTPTMSPLPTRPPAP